MRTQETSKETMAIARARVSNYMSSRYVSLVAMMLVLAACQLDFAIMRAPEEVRLAAWDEAQRYIGMEYEYGGQDVPKGIDCSGLVVNCYAAAVAGARYQLLFRDASVQDLFRQYTVAVDMPETGDLIFLGNGTISHVAIYEKEEVGEIWFIDAYSETGYVAYRSYESTNPKLLAFGRLLIRSR